LSSDQLINFLLQGKKVLSSRGFSIAASSAPVAPDVPTPLRLQLQPVNPS